MATEREQIEEVLRKIAEAELSWRDSGTGRVYDVGNLVLYEGQLATVIDLNKGSEDPTGSTVDIRLHDGKVIEGVKVASKLLQRYRS